MKRFILMAAAALMCAAAAPAQTNAPTTEQQRADSLQNEVNRLNHERYQEELNKRVWGSGRFTRLMYSISETVDDYSPVYKSKFSFAIQKGVTYSLHKKPIAGLIKIGLDAVWIDAQFSKFKDDDSIWSSDILVPVDDEDEDGEGDPFESLNLGRWAISYSMGVGPNVSIAPFARTSIKGLQPLRLSAYFHYAPTYMAYAVVDNGDVEMSTAFCNMMTFGGNLRYRGIAVGVEGKWGQGKFKPLDFESMFDEEGEGSGLGTQKYTRKFANTRIYIQFAF